MAEKFVSSTQVEVRLVTQDINQLAAAYYQDGNRFGETYDSRLWDIVDDHLYDSPSSAKDRSYDLFQKDRKMKSLVRSQAINLFGGT